MSITRQGVGQPFRPHVPDQGNNIDTNTYTRNKTTNNSTNRNLSLPLNTNQRVGRESKSMDTSLDSSPVDEGIIKRFACSFYVSMNDLMSPPRQESKSLDDLRSTEVIRECGFENGCAEGSDYSSDSLEEPRPRRCISEYQIAPILSFSERTKSHSEENILGSSGFFLRNKENCRSEESILTDESEYQFLFGSKDVFRSTESILTEGEESPVKRAVSRTRSLQDCEKPAAPTKTKNESFFIPLNDSETKPRPNPPVIAHKPPKPRAPSSKIKSVQRKLLKHREGGRKEATEGRVGGRVAELSAAYERLSSRPCSAVPTLMSDSGSSTPCSSSSPKRHPPTEGTALLA